MMKGQMFIQFVILDP